LEQFPIRILFEPVMAAAQDGQVAWARRAVPVVGDRVVQVGEVG
jgi:hypothetical protein